MRRSIQSKRRGYVHAIIIQKQQLEHRNTSGRREDGKGNARKLDGGFAGVNSGLQRPLPAPPARREFFRAKKYQCRYLGSHFLSMNLDSPATLSCQVEGTSEIL